MCQPYVLGRCAMQGGRTCKDWNAVFQPFCCKLKLLYNFVTKTMLLVSTADRMVLFEMPMTISQTLITIYLKCVTQKACNSRQNWFLKQESACWGLQISVGRPWLLARTTLGFFCLLHFIVFCVCLMERDVAADFDNRLIFSNTVGTNLFLWPLLRSGTSSSATLSFAKTNRRRGWDDVISYFKVWTQIVWHGYSERQR